MSKASDNYQLLIDYFALPQGPDRIERMASFYTEDKPAYISGDSSLSGDIKNTEEAVQYLHKLNEMTDGAVESVGTPTILVAGDKVVAALLYQRHHQIGKPELIVPRLCVYEVTEGKLSRVFIWQLESEIFDEYYPRS